jgi:chromosomal replication initiator protein
MKIEDIIKVVCKEFEISPETLQSKSRKRGIVTPRQVIHYFAKNNTKLSYESIGILGGFKDHSTVIYSCKVVGDLIETNREFRERIYRLDKILGLIALKESQSYESLPDFIAMLWDPWKFLEYKI